IIDGDEQDGFTPLNGADTIKQIGLQGVNPQNLNAQGFPRMDITGFTSLETRPGGLNDDNDYFVFDNATTWSVGRHVFKFGAQFYTFEDWIGIIPTNNWGRYRFNGSITGHPHADFLLGLPWRTQRVNPFVDRNRTQKEFALYFRDTFKVSPKLSVDYGLRWDYYSSPTFDDGLQFNWDPQTGNVIVPEAALSSISPLYPDNINVVTGQVVADPELSNFRPRIGFAYRLREDLVVRGGYGTFTERIGYFSRSFGGGPFEIAEDYRQSLSDFVNGQPLFQFPNPFLDVSSSRVPSQSISSYPLQTDEGTIHQFNLSVEKRVSDTGFRISYIGSRNRGQNYSLNTNKPRPSATPFSTDLRPFPQFVSTSVIRADGSSNYDSLQLQAEKKVGAVTFNAHWTWANNMVNFLNRENPFDVTSHWARDASTRRQRVVVNTGFELPFGRGHRYLSDASGVVEQLLGGWKVQTVSILATGEYLSPSFSGSDPSNTNSFGGLPDRIADGNLSSPTVDRWFDGSAFVRPPAGVGRFGNSGLNILEGQGMNVHHASLAKTFPIGERFNLVYTAAFSNLFNHPHFNSIRRNVTASDPGKYVSIHNAFWAEKGSHRRVIMKLRLEF
ncbi:TonB-dependent receptor, partial [Acidobacteria bacterium AH-259-O06]|nr:TonB-dependent receptor [Acidobacteria bacterium AH-259-O06]